ncbi:MAG: thioredoxin fold domain-containing protein [Burkholderiales bacterium]
MTRRLALLAALLLACVLAPARAAEGWEKFFELSFGDLRAEAADAKQDGKRGLLLMYHFDDCPYCQRMKQEVLQRPEVQAYFRKAFRAIAIDTRGAQAITGFDGRTLPENQHARAAGVRGTPTFQFHDLDGKLLFTHGRAIYDPAEFMLLGDYVASGAYRTTSFAVYRQAKHKRGS